VTLVPSPSGEPKVVLEAGQSAGSGFAIRREGTRIEVIPHRVLPLVPDVLDPNLFDVAGLAAMGYDDASADAIPLIVHRAPGIRAVRANPALGKAIELPSIRSAAVPLDKRRAGEFGADLAALAARPGPATTSAGADALGEIDRIWLDAKVTGARASLAEMAPEANGLAAADPDPYLTQIGAPEAWATGLDGSGVTVAILDSGVDSGHPALTGRVTGEQNFTDSGSAEDRVGHGTHVASLVAGSGTGAEGARQGIAPAADLLNGKVLGDEGEGRLSWVIAGMEWAAAQGADIVNLSLAARAGLTDDPVVQSLDELARTTGALFVVAAGNSGWNGWVPETVTSPGTAASALTVGAVDERDAVPGFSGQGPTRGSYRAKPDVTAPGVEILGARAGARDGDLYVPMTGTSMATPLVAGAAALVKQLHGDWSWEQVKSAVTASADPMGPAWSAGAGRLALERVVDVDTTAVPSTLSPGPALHPNESPLITTVTLRNTGAEERTYSASDLQTAPADGTEAPENALVVTPATLTLAPGDSASVDVAFDPAQVDDGYWHGYVDLSVDDGSGLRLPFATYDEPERYQVDVTVLDRNGDPYAGAAVPLLNVDNGYYYTAWLDDDGQARLRVAPGTYSAVTVVSTEEDGGTTTAVVGTPALDVHADAALIIDARDAEQVRSPAVHGQATRATEFSMTWNAVAANGSGYGDVIAPPVEEVVAGRVFVTPAGRGVGGTFEAAIRWRLEPEGRRGPKTPDGYELVYVHDGLADPATPELTQREVGRLAEVTEHSYAPERGAAVVRGLVSASPQTYGIVHWRELTAPRTETVLMTAGPDVSWGYDNYWVNEGPLRLYSEQTPLEPRAEVEHHFRRGLHVGIPAGSAHHSQWGLFVEQGLTDGELSGHLRVDQVRSASTALYADGELVGTSPDVFGWFDVPAERTAYRLLGDVQLTDGRSARTAWTFASEAPTDPDVGSTVPPLLTVDYGPSVGLLGAARSDQDLRFDLRIGHLLGAVASERIETARLQWSLDGGATWQDASIRRTGPATFAATVKAVGLRNGGTVSVRLDATDVDGNTIEQTLPDFVPLD
jgi:subtilisin family serine protease